ncbi:MAG: DUF1929 domain-containing protein [Silvanigrellales bacterium]|nr:DUF1929 domain-containing protein [Silvanigrellales bacterium]
MPARKDRMQAVHAVLLPSGKVLMVNGTSARDNASPSTYAHVDNTALFDPNSNSFRRIPSSPWPGQNRPDIDLFCSGHVQLWNGNVLFAGGTRSYERNFQAHPASYEFDWQKESWSFTGNMGEGKWYPTLVPRADGSVVALGGINEEGDDQIATTFEIYNPFEGNTAKRWSTFDARDRQGQSNSPFTLDWGIDHYPRVFARTDGRLYLTNDGTGYGNRTTRRSYFFDFPTWSPGQFVDFAPGPTRADRTRTYASAFLDPTREDGSIVLIGGQQGSADQTFGPRKPIANAAVTASLERYDATTNAWSLVPNFLEQEDLKGRVNHMAVILPSKQVLVVGGAAYHFYEPAFEPQLLTPDKNAPGGFRKDVMNPMTQPRLYHMNALLLPDGRVWVAGGNFKRGFLNTDGTVDLGSGTSQDGRTDDFENQVFPAEIWQHEIYSPPYLFLPGPRPVISQAPSVAKYGTEVTLNVANAVDGASVVAIRLGSATHSFDMGQRLLSLPVVSQDTSSGTVKVRVPNEGGRKNLYTPGYYMFFYVTPAGKPSKAAMVRLSGD